MNRRLYHLCQEYIKCYDVLDCLISVDGLEAESLKLFRLTKDRTEELEEDFIRIITSKEVNEWKIVQSYQ